MADRPTLRLGIRYGSVAVLLSFGIGVVMSIISGRHVGDEGNLLVAHGLGVHGLQTLPLVALVLAVAWGEGRRTATPWIHAAGIGWLVACTAAIGQAVLGWPPFEPTVLTGLMVAGLAAWAVVAGRALISWRSAVRRHVPA